jgi:alpha,alpha-trehalase
MTTIISPETLHDEGINNDFHRTVLESSDPIRTSLFLAAIVPDWKVLADHTITSDMQAEWQYFSVNDPDFAPHIFAQKHNLLMATQVEHTASVGETIEQHLSNMWTPLTRDMSVPTATRLALEHEHVVPGDRFDEGYYWDSYFAMLGYATEGKWDTIRGMVDNFSRMLEEHGMIPNGNRTYYLNRSQPPFFAKMVELLAQHDGPETYINYCPALETEYNFWMDGIDELKPGESHRRLVCNPDGSFLNRNYCDGDGPREEMLPHDIFTAHLGRVLLGRKPEEVYREIGAICERGEDMTSLVLEDGKNLYTANATSILPVGLNCQLRNLEATVAHAHKLAGNRAQAQKFEQRARARGLAIEKYFWNENEGFYLDYNFIQQQPVRVQALTGLSPLYMGFAPPKKAQRVLRTVSKHFVDDLGGAANNLIKNSEHQWDGRRYWSFTNEMAIVAARRYREYGLSRRIGAGFLRIVRQGFEETGQFVEKYCPPGSNNSVIACAGEYSKTPSGFAPTNGLVQALIKSRSTPELQFWLHGEV